MTETIFMCSSPLDRLRVRLHGLKMRRQKRVAVLPVVECRGSSCREESRISHTEEAKDRPQIGLDKVERGHLRLRIIDPAGRDDECRFFAREQPLRLSIRIGKSPAHARDLVDPELQNRGHTEIMHRHAPNTYSSACSSSASNVSESASNSFCCGVRASSGV